MLYLMRHGQTDWNREYRLQGRTDIPLNDTGREMAAKARERYPDLSVDICYCSPLSRARETAEIFLAGRNVPIVPDGRIAEMSFGKYEGIQSVIDHPELPIRDLFGPGTLCRRRRKRELSGSLCQNRCLPPGAGDSPA